jgi:hypothetical protein
MSLVINQEPQHARRFDVLWFLFWVLASTAWCITAALALGVTFDERFYITYGLGWWRGEYLRVLVAGTMPLSTDVQTLPLYLWELVRGARFDVKDDFFTLLTIARFANLIFWWALLFYGWRLGRLLAGRWGGNLTVAFLACEPNLLAHACLATTDISQVACLLGFAYYYRAGRDAPQENWKARVLWPLLWCALALLSKVSAGIYAVVIVLCIEIELAWPRGQSFGGMMWPAVRETITKVFTRRQVREWLQIFGGGVLLMFVYCGIGCTTHPVLVKWAAAAPAGTQKQILTWMATNLPLYPGAADGIYLQLKHNAVGHAWSLLGQSDSQGSIWYYFPVVLAIKSSLPLLVAALLVFWRPRAFWNWAGASALVFLAMSLFHHVQNGVRQMFPLMALAIIVLAGAWGNTRADSKPTPQWRLWALGVLTLWMAMQAAFLWPRSIMHVNALWGGTANGYRIVSSSNYDMGQGMPELLRWKQANQVETMALWYFGTDARAEQKSFEQIPFEYLPQNEQQFLARVQGKYLAVGATVLYGSYGNTLCNERQCNPAIGLLRERQPLAKVGPFLIYDFTQK